MLCHKTHICGLCFVYLFHDFWDVYSDEFPFGSPLLQYNLSHTSHLWFFLFSWTSWMCFFKEPGTENDFSHEIPTFVIFSTLVELLENVLLNGLHCEILSHKRHIYGLSDDLHELQGCVSSRHMRDLIIFHSIHISLYGLHALSWNFRLCDWVNDLPHESHLWSFCLSCTVCLWLRFLVLKKDVLAFHTEA